MAMGCLSCHEIRVNKDVTRVKLITATPSALCLTCHATRKRPTSRGRCIRPRCATASPATIRTSDNKNQLLKPMSGGEKENLCLSCHQTGLNVPEKGSRHAALDMGCDTCHVTHKTGAEPTMDNKFHLTKAAPALCLDCHDAKDADLQKAHQGQPFATANCMLSATIRTSPRLPS
jgi:predicted CXXCH cytochrome family protein